MASPGHNVLMISILALWWYITYCSQWWWFLIGRWISCANDVYFSHDVYVCMSLQWRHNGISNHQPHDCLLNRLFMRRSKKTSKFRVTGLCAGNSPVTHRMFPFDGVIMVCTYIYIYMEHTRTFTLFSRREIGHWEEVYIIIKECQNVRLINSLAARDESV